MPQSDHDLLIKLDTNQANLIDEVRLLRDGSAKRLADVEQGKLDKKVFDDFFEKEFGDHETRLRRVERYLWMGLGILGFVDFVLTVISIVKHS